jgi:bifunctional NMN adenylyltransferase/nudix hydrolase
MAKPKWAVFIGRFQPFHRAHHEILRHSLERYDRVIVGVGSARQARSPRNPFTAEERIRIIESALSSDERARVSFMPLRDYLYNDNQWIVDVQQKVASITESDEGPISIVGRLKDRTSYYLRMFPQWPCDEYVARHPEDATRVRRALFDGELAQVAESVPPSVAEWLAAWQKTDEFRWVLEEDRFVERYKELWKSAPYAPTFVTTDAVLVQAGHVLVVRRRSAPGKGLYALPGGFLNPVETIEAGMLRELKEETGIAVPKEVLKGSIVGERVFDHPDRSLRGRTITHGFCIHLRDGDLVPVKGGDDADKAFWMPLADLYEHEDRFFEDHVHIIRYFTSRF